jgi:hypothetical protein
MPQRFISLSSKELKKFALCIAACYFLVGVCAGLGLHSLFPPLARWDWVLCIIAAPPALAAYRLKMRWRRDNWTGRPQFGQASASGPSESSEDPPRAEQASRAVDPEQHEPSSFVCVITFSPYWYIRGVTPHRRIRRG